LTAVTWPACKLPAALPPRAGIAAGPLQARPYYYYYYVLEKHLSQDVKKPVASGAHLALLSAHKKKKEDW